MLRAPLPVIQAMYAQFGYPDVRIGWPLTGYRTTLYPAVTAGGLQLNLLVHKQEKHCEARIRRTHYLELAVAETTLPVRQPLDARILRLKFGNTTRLATLSNYLPGSTIPWEAYTMKHIKLLGWAMGALHQAMQPVDTAPFSSVYEEYLGYVAQMRRYFSNPNVVGAMQQKLRLTFDPTVLDQFESFLLSAKLQPGQQVLHMDMVRGNVLFDTADVDSPLRIADISLSGILDFEKAAVGHTEFDVARTLAFLLADCSNKTASQIRKYFLHSGYEKRGGGARPDRVYLRRAVDLCLLHDLYALLAHNPYESLAENYHFCRTRDILIERKMVQYT